MRILRLFMAATLLSCALGPLYGCSKKSKPEAAKKATLKVPDSVMFYTGTDQPNTLLTARNRLMHCDHERVRKRAKMMLRANSN